jgi:hypothetical protein
VQPPVSDQTSHSADGMWRCNKEGGACSTLSHGGEKTKNKHTQNQKTPHPNKIRPLNILFLE